MAAEEWIGRTLARTYLIEKVLGAGGMGAVYQAKHLRIDKLVAVKILKPDFAKEDEALRRFRIEAKIISELRHPHIVQVHDFYEQNQSEGAPVPFLVMDYLEGEDLHTRLRRCGRLTYDEACKLALEVGSALQAAHNRDIVHRDIKPMNLFVHRQQSVSSDEEVYKVVDFGISKIQDSSRQTPTLMFMGTPHYSAPEAASAQRDAIDGRSDQFSLAVVLYRALTGRLPFEGSDSVGVLYQVIHHQPEPIARLMPALPAHAAQAVERAMAKSKSERFPSVWEFAQAFSGSPRSGYARRPSSIASGAASAETVRLTPGAELPDWPSGFAAPAMSAPAAAGSNSDSLAHLEASRLTPNSLSQSTGQRKPKVPTALQPVFGGVFGLGVGALIGLGIWALRPLPTPPAAPLSVPAQPGAAATSSLAAPQPVPPPRPQVIPLSPRPQSTPAATAKAPIAPLQARPRTYAVSPPAASQVDRRSSLSACSAQLELVVQPAEPRPLLDRAFRDFLRQAPPSKELCPCPRVLKFQRNFRRSGRFALQGQPGAGVSESGLDALLTWLNNPGRIPWAVQSIQLSCRERSSPGSSALQP